MFDPVWRIILDVGSAGEYLAMFNWYIKKSMLTVKIHNEYEAILLPQAITAEGAARSMRLRLTVMRIVEAGSGY